MRTAEGPLPAETTYTWEAVGEGATRMTLRNRGTPSGFSNVFARFMAMAMHRANREDRPPHLNWMSGRSNIAGTLARRSDSVLASGPLTMFGGDHDPWRAPSSASETGYCPRR